MRTNHKTKGAALEISPLFGYNITVVLVPGYLFT